MSTDYKHKDFVNDLAFALGQTGACTVLDLVGDPYIGEKVQDYLAPEFKGHEMHTRKAEFAADVSGLVVFMGAQRYAPGIVKGIKKSTQKMLDPIYEKIGQNRLQDWAKRHDVDPKSKEFRAKLDEWKDFQIGNFAKATFIAGASAAINVAIQKGLHNPRDWKVITVGKLAGATVTLGATMGIRAFAPRTIHHMDEAISKYVVKPVLHQTHKIMGIDANELPGTDDLDMPTPAANAKNFRMPAGEAVTSKSFSQRMSADKDEQVANRS